MAANRSKVLGSVLLGGLLTLDLAGCRQEEVVTKASVEKINNEQVRINNSSNLKIEVAQERQYPLTLEFNGRATVPDKDTFSVSSRVVGRLENLLVSVGDSVKKGQPVAQIWSSDLVTSAQEYALAKKEGGELKTLTELKLRSLGLEPVEAVLGRTTFSMRSPIDGVVLEKKVNVGSALNAGDVILTIGKMEALHFTGDLPPDAAVQVKTGMKIQFDDYKDLAARVESVSAVSDPTTHMVKVRASFDQQPGQNVPQESFLKSHVILGEIKAMVFPAKSLILRNDGEYAFIQDDKDPQVFKRIKLAVRERNNREIALDSSAPVFGAMGEAGVKTVSEGAVLLNDVLDNAGDD